MIGNVHSDPLHYSQGASQLGDQSLTLFVGCLDPQTTKEDLIFHFKNFDPWVKAKLIVNFKTGQSKQCGLLFCSSAMGLKSILQAEHSIHQRKVRVNQAQNEYKGTKISELFQIQISGLDPDITIDAISEVFENFHGFNKARLVQGLHPKQKKVAILYFDGLEAAQAVLNNSHVKVGQRNCKVSPYNKDTNSIPVSKLKFSEDFGISTPALGSDQGTDRPFGSQPHIDLVPKMMKSETSSIGHRPLSPLKLVPMDQFKNHQSKADPFEIDDEGHNGPQAFVHPVEEEKDSLYRIFCLPPPPKFDPRENPQLKISSESKETRDE